jgi:HTH-type transcriptional regulator/antitoxin HigA
MPTTKDNAKLPGRFAALVEIMPPQAIADDVQLANTLEMIDRLMAAGKLTKGQQSYLETLVQLVEVYEAENHSIDVSDIHGLEALRHLLDLHGMTASDLARLLGVHVSLGSKILKGDRALTVEHMKALSDRFKVRADVFM